MMVVFEKKTIHVLSALNLLTFGNQALCYYSSGTQKRFWSWLKLPKYFQPFFKFQIMRATDVPATFPFYFEIVGLLAGWLYWFDTMGTKPV